MTRGLKIVLSTFILSLPFWWGMNLLEKNLNDFFFWYKISQNPQIFTAQLALEEKLREMKPIRNKEIPDLEIEAKSAISVLVNEESEEEVLFEKEGNQKLPIASLTKLMTAKIIVENYDLNSVTEISEKAAKLPGNGFQRLKAGERFYVKDLLYLILMESNNAAALSLAEIIGEEKFLEIMNLEAKNLGLENSHFSNPTGLDDPELYSTTKDLVKLTVSLLKENNFIWEVLLANEFDLYSLDGNFVYTITNTNELLEKIPLIVGGKTGETPEAGGCLLLVTKAPKSQGYLINIILNSENRFSEMEKLINWVKTSYKW